MRKKSTRAVALALAALLTLGPAASASQALGTEIHMGRTHLAQGVEYTRQYLWSATYSDLRTERYIEYSPSALVQPVVAYGDTVLSKNTLSSLAQGLESQGKRVLGGVNGDYFVIATGAPLGMVITDGVLRSSSSYHYALGFDAEGNAFIGKPELTITATFGENTLAVSGGLNKVRTATGGYFLYTDDYNATTNHSDPGVDVILIPDTDRLGQKVNVDLDVDEVEPDTDDTDPGAEETDRGTEETDPGAEETDPGAEETDPGTEETDPGAEETDPGVEETDPGAEEPDLGTEETDPDTPPTEDEEIVTGSEELDPEELPAEGEETDPVTQIRDTLIYTDVPVIGGRVSCTVAQVLHSTGSIDIPEGCLVLSINNKSNEWLVSQLSSLQPGDTVEIDITSPDAQWESAVTAVGGLYKMVTDGVVESGLETTQAPRTAVGIKADGTTVFYTVDGRQSGYSVGASMEQVAKRLVELGCVEAVCMDGGGSTTLGVSLPGGESFDVLSRPSDGAERAVTNALFLAAEQTEPGRAERLTVSPGDAMVLSGTRLALSAFSVDDLGQTVKRYEGDEVDFDLPREGGIVEDGVLTAGSQAGVYTLEAGSGRLTGEALITVVSTPDRIAVRDEETGVALSSIHLEPGESLDLTARGVYRNLALLCQDEAFSWEITEGMGTVDPSGTLTAGPASGTGSLTVTAGERTVTIPVTVASHIYTVEDFEGDFTAMAGSLTAQIEPERDPAYVRFGRQSARITYDMGESEFAAVSVDLSVQDGEQYITLWVYGDGSGNTLTAPVYLADGSSDELILAVLNFNGWQQIVTPLPAGVQHILALKLSGGGGQGTIWLDQVTSSNQHLPDDAPPDVTVELAENTLRAVLYDNMGETFAARQVRVTYDGVELPFALEDNIVTAPLPEWDGLAHRVTVTAADASGNIGKGSADIAADPLREQPFGDMGEHWAQNYVNYLHDQGISDGLAVGEEAHFLPDQELTRGEFALMAIRWLRLDPAAYSGVELPFVDLESIPAGYLDSVKAMYALGIMLGSTEFDGTYAFSEEPLSRAEAMTMLGRIQEKGYATAALEFTDAAEVPVWAVDYMATMVAQGIIEGYPEDDTVRPSVNLKRCQMAKILYAMR